VDQPVKLWKLAPHLKIDLLETNIPMSAKSLRPLD